MQKPNFLIIGAAKSGTTSLYHYLWQHPDIGFSKIKEPKYFSFKDISLEFSGHPKGVSQIKKTTITKKEDYLLQFTNIQQPNIGEASPNYFHFAPAAKNIYEFNSKMRLIVILRNPVERIYSDWKHNVRMGWEPIKNFRKIIKITNFRMKNNGLPYYDYFNKGNYATHLKRFYTFFPKDQIQILFYDDFKNDPGKICNQVTDFLGCKEIYDFNTEHIYMENRYTPKSKFWMKISKKSGKVSLRLERYILKLNAVPDKISDKDKAIVQDYYHPEILELENLTNRNLKAWLS